MHHLNAERQNSGQTLVSHREALPLFHNWAVQRLNRQSPVLEIGNVTFPSTLQQPNLSEQGSIQADDPRVELKSPFLPMNKSLNPQTLESINKRSSSINQIVDATHTQRSDRNHEQQQRHDDFRGTPRSTLMSCQDIKNVFHVPESNYSVVSPVIAPRSTFGVQATPTQAITEARDDTPEIRRNKQFQYPGFCSSHRNNDCESTLSDTSDRRKIQNSLLSISNNESSNLNIESSRPKIGSEDVQNSGNGFKSSNLLLNNGVSVLPPILAQTGQQGLNDGFNQQSSSGEEKSHTYRHTIDPALLLNGETDLPDSNSLSEQTSSYNPLGSTENLSGPLITSFDQLSNRMVLQDLSTARKHLLPPPSACTRPALFTRSVSALTSSSIPVCLNCYENWWNESCDTGEPCQNCIAVCKPCERPRCLNFAVGTCTVTRCPRVHEGDLRYKNVVARPKTLKRICKKGEARTSPNMLTYRQG